MDPDPKIGFIFISLNSVFIRAGEIRSPGLTHRSSKNSEAVFIYFGVLLVQCSEMTSGGTQESWIKPGFAVCKASFSSAAFSLFLPLSECQGVWVWVWDVGAPHHHAGRLAESGTWE